MAMTYEESMARNARQRAYIEQLRKQQAQPEGQMVGGQYIAPHWSQQLQPLVGQVMAGYMGRKQDAEDVKLRQEMQTGADQWMQERPQTTQQEVQGPPEEGQAAPTRLVEPTQQDRLAWAQRGQQNPLTKALAAKYGEDVLIKEPEREEARVARADNLKAQAVARMDQIREQGSQRLQELELRLQDQGLTREQTAKIQAQIDETKRAMGELSSQTAKAVANIAADSRRDAATIAAQAKVEAATAKPPKPLPAAQAKAWTENNVSFGKAQRALDMISAPHPKDPNKRVPKKEAESAMGAQYMIPFSEEVGQRLDPKGVAIRAAISDIGSMKIHERSGAAVSAKEHPRLKPFVPTSSDRPEAAAEKLQNFMAEYKLIQQEIENFAEDQGYNNPAIDKAGKRREGPGVTNPEAVVQPPSLATPGINPGAKPLPQGWKVN